MSATMSGAARIEHTLPTIDQVEASGEWVCARNSGIAPSWFTYVESRFKPREKKDVHVQIARTNGRVHTWPVTFYKRKAIARLRAAWDPSEAMKKRWEGCEEIVEGEQTLLRKGQMCELLDVSSFTLERWSDEQEPGIPCWGNRHLAKVRRKTSTGRRWYWYRSEGENLNRARRKIPTKPKREDLYTLKQTMKRSGLCKAVLLSPKKREAYCLEIVKVAVKVSCHVRVPKGQSTPKKKPRRLEKVFFTKTSVDNFVKNRKKAGIPEAMSTLSEAVSDHLVPACRRLKVRRPSMTKNLRHWCSSKLIACTVYTTPVGMPRKVRGNGLPRYLLNSATIYLVKRVLRKARSLADAGRLLQAERNAEVARLHEAAMSGAVGASQLGATLPEELEQFFRPVTSEDDPIINRQHPEQHNAIVDRLDRIVERLPTPPAGEERQPQPTRDYCLAEGYTVQWDEDREPIELRRYLWHFLGAVLDSWKDNQAAFADVERAYGQKLSAKQISNYVSELADPLRAINWPWDYGTGSDRIFSR